MIRLFKDGKLFYKNRFQDLDFLIDDEGRIVEAYFVAGCPGNTQGVCSLIKGMKIEDVIPRLKGITCGNKTTSCPDQLALMLEKILENA